MLEVRIKKFAPQKYKTAIEKIFYNFLEYKKSQIKKGNCIGRLNEKKSLELINAGYRLLKELSKDLNVTRGPQKIG